MKFNMNTDVATERHSSYAAKILSTTVVQIFFSCGF
jgi:hypothetical protein